MKPAAVLVAVALLALAAAAPRDTAQSYGFIGAVWPDEMMPIPYCVNATQTPIGSTGAPMLTPDEFAYQVWNAFQTWEDIPTSYISFAYMGFCENIPGDQYDATNAVGWGRLWLGAAGLADPTMTHGDYQRGGLFGQLYEMDIVIDTRHAQSFDDASYYINVLLPHILLHEVGHFIGLDHSTEPCAVMSPTGVRPGLCWDDIEGISVLYPQR